MKTHYLLLGVLGLSLSALTSCHDDKAPTLQPGSDTPTVTLSIESVSTGSISRANPIAESAMANERAINSAVIVIYDRPMNSGEGTVLKVIRLNDLGGGTNIKQPESTDNMSWYDAAGVKQTLTYYTGLNAIVDNRVTVTESTDLAQELISVGMDREVYAVAMANMDLPANKLYAGMPVTELRELVYTGDLYQGPKFTWHTEEDGTHSLVDECHDFAMAAVNEVKFKIEFTDERLTLPVMMVQRLAARIDICFGVQATEFAETDDEQRAWNEENYNRTDNTHYITDRTPQGAYRFDVDVTSSGYYRFPIYSEEEYQKGNLLRLTDQVFTMKYIKILNAVEHGSYVFEKSSGTPKYLGSEGSWVEATSGNSYAQNFIYSCDDREIADRDITESQTPYWPISQSLQMVAPKLTLQACNSEEDRRWGVRAIVGYVGENTFAPRTSETDANDDPYTGIYLGGVTTIGKHFTESDEEVTDENQNETSTPMGVTVYLRHSFGTKIEPAENLYYGIVRNTIYRLYVRFFAKNEELMVRWYYYDGADGNFREVEYQAKFDKYITDDGGTRPNIND